jgi:TolB-like protein/tRNA A-37 threonylcarbamoyl transferase component Bud32/Flp pilus assembly protein TadD
MAIQCPKCHSENPEVSLFCSDCGTKLEAAKEFSLLQTETLRASLQELNTGSTFAGRYQVIEELGKGGMGMVYKVFDKKIKEKIALKLIKPEIASNRETIERFSNELKLARKIRHKNVCGMFDIGEAEGAQFITMEYVSGEDLKTMIRMSGLLGIGTVLSVGKQICDGLTEAHSQGIVHRDLKPTNIMIDKGGNVKIMDFGIARSLRERGMTGPSVLIGTPEYMSPEQAEAKEVDQRSDIYSLGIILYEMATGRVPFEGDTALAIAMKHKGEIPKNPKLLNPNVPDDLSGVILKCLEKDRAKRYESAAAVRSELEKIEKGIPTAERVVPEKKAFTSKEVTVTFGLKKLLLPALGLLFLVLAAVVAWKILPKKEAAPAAAAKKSIAVLPFEDLSQAKNNEYLCDGISETLITALTNIEGLWVPARTSAFFFKGKTQDIREIGQKLGVENVLEGSVQVVGDNLRVTARISNVRDGRQVWAEIYNRKIADIFAIQDNIAKAIVLTLKIKLLGETGAPLVKNYTDNLEAYSLYLQGRNYWNKRDEKNLTKSIEYFAKAIEIDPNYALAYVGLGDAYYVLGQNAIWPAEKVLTKAKAAIAKALEIDEQLAEAHASSAAIKMDLEWDFDGAEKEYRLAIKLKPDYASVHQWYAGMFQSLGRNEEAIKESQIARNLDPLSPRIGLAAGLCLYYARRYSQAIEELNKTLELDPNHLGIYSALGNAYEATGKYEEAIRAFLQSIERSGGSKDRDVDMASCYALMGKRDEAREMLDHLIAYSKENYVPSSSIAMVFSTLGDKEQTFFWLEKAFRERDPQLIEIIRGQHRFDPLRSDPRFTDLLKRIGLEK